MMCARCKELEEQVAELEEALKGAVWPKRDDVATLQAALNLSPQQAKIIFLAYRVGEERIPAYEIACAVTDSMDGGNVVRKQMTKIRGRLGKAVFDNRSGRGGGVRLSAPFRPIIRDILKSGGGREASPKLDAGARTNPAPGG